MAVTTLLNNLTLDKSWTSVTLTDTNDFYLIALRQTKANNDTVDPADVIKVKFEVAIDSGVNNKPLTIGYLTVNFNDSILADNDLFGTAAYTRALNYPESFFIRPIELITNSEIVTTGKTTIKVNMNAVVLGAN